MSILLLGAARSCFARKCELRRMGCFILLAVFKRRLKLPILRSPPLRAKQDQPTHNAISASFELLPERRPAPGGENFRK
jgi:hypothetical protein